MKIAYVFATDMSATYKLGKMILPQLEQGVHGAQVVGMMFLSGWPKSPRRTISY
jgi:hypothetical protein